MKILNIGDNIISSLGMTTEENLAAIACGHSGVEHYTDRLGVREPYSASFVDDAKLDSQCSLAGIPDEGFTRFERMMMASIVTAAKHCSEVLSDRRTLFVFSTTKGNVELLDDGINGGRFPRERCYLWRSAELVANHFGNVNTPVVVSNACISGVAAQMVAKRMIEAGRCDTAVVVGADVLSKFVVSGFQSFKAISEGRCKPFDRDRTGLNIGEGAGTLIYQRADDGAAGPHLMACSVTNDANHISGPSRTGEGLFRALQKVLRHVGRENLQFVNVHGTATPYNDEMEAIALGRAGLLQVPTFSLKAYLGHTLGASGTIETIISTHALMAGFVPQSLGCETLGVSQPVNITFKKQACRREGLFVKTVSGFGGCNAAIAVKV